MKDGKIKINGREVEVSNTEKVFFQDSRISKGDVIDYYRRAAEYILPHVTGRPLSMHRFPDGIEGNDFYHKRVSDYFPSWLRTTEVELEKGGREELVILDDAASFVYLANQAVLVFHIWLSREDNIRKPDKIVFDLDPPGNASEDFKKVKSAAFKVRENFEDEDFIPHVMTTGSKGLHVVIPVEPENDFDTVRDIVRERVSELVEKYPEELTDETRKEKRGGRVFLDYLRNAYGQTSVAPYSLRGLKNAPVATPLDWEELRSIEDPRKYNMKNIFRRLSQKDDPWKDFENKKRRIKR